MMERGPLAAVAALAAALQLLLCAAPARAADDWSRIRLGQPLEAEFARACPDAALAQRMRDLGHSFAAKGDAPDAALDMLPKGCTQRAMVITPLSEEHDLGGITVLKFIHAPKASVRLSPGNGWPAFRYAWQEVEARYFRADLSFDGKTYRDVIVELLPGPPVTHGNALNWAAEDAAAQP
jgi:hypothetical protein